MGYGTETYCQTEGQAYQETLGWDFTDMLIEEYHDYTDADGNALRGYFIYLRDLDTSSTHPGLIVFPAFYGNGGGHNERETARGYARQGLVAFLPDYFPGDHSENNVNDIAETFGFYHGKFFQTQNRAQNLALLGYNQLANLNFVDQNNIAAIGYCFGGAMTLACARAGCNLKVAASLHGEYPEYEQPTGQYSVGYFNQFVGTADPFIPQTGIDAWNSELAGFSSNYRVTEHDGSVHAFSIMYSDAFYTFIAGVFNSVKIYDA